MPSYNIDLGDILCNKNAAQKCKYLPMACYNDIFDVTKQCFWVATKATNRDQKKTLIIRR